MARSLLCFDVVLRDCAVVLDALFRQEVRCVGLLQQGVTHVLLITENLVDSAGVPLRFTCAGENAVSHKTGDNLIHAGAFEVLPVDALYDFSLLRIDDEVIVLVFGVAEETVVVDLAMNKEFERCCSFLADMIIEYAPEIKEEVEVCMMIRFSWDNSEHMCSHFITKK